MENENKNNGQPYHKKKRHHKRKGYFIDPKAKPENGSVDGAQNAVTENKQTANQQTASQNNRQEHHNKKPNKHSGHKNHHGGNKDNQHHAPQKKQEVIREETVVPAFNADEYEEVHFPAASLSEASETVTSEEPVKMVEVVGIRFKSSGKVYYFLPNGKTLHRGQYAIVETSRGQEYGEVAMGNKEVKETDTVPPLRSIVRIATEADTAHHKDNKEKEDEAFRVCNEKIISHGLDMKLIDAQYTFDNSKLLFYFTSAGRVDFRELVKDLASVFRTRIELRQIGIRDEAKLMGGMGMCGRPLCCSLFLSDFGQVSIKMAKEQNLSLNSAKISGICGRLMCCLRYEHEAYEYEIKRTPPVDALVHTADGNGTVTEINPLRGTIKVRLNASPDTPPKLYKREDVVMLQKKHNKDAEAKDKE